MATPGPFIVERHDLSSGAFRFEIWDTRPESYRRLCSIHEWFDSATYSDDKKRPKNTAKSDTEMIAAALNEHHSLGLVRAHT